MVAKGKLSALRRQHPLTAEDLEISSLSSVSDASGVLLTGAAVDQSQTSSSAISEYETEQELDEEEESEQSDEEGSEADALQGGSHPPEPDSLDKNEEVLLPGSVHAQ